MSDFQTANTKFPLLDWHLGMLVLVNMTLSSIMLRQ